MSEVAHRRILSPVIPSWTSEKRFPLAIALFSTGLVLLALVYRTVQQDDAYIFYTYALRVFENQEWAFNAGDPSYATTSPLYTALLALAYSVLHPLFGLDMPVIGHVIGALSLWYLAFAGMRLLRREDLHYAGLVFPFALLLNPLLRDGVGMETALTLALIMLSFTLYLRGDYLWFAAACGVAVLSRPDAILVPGVLALDYMRRERRLPPVRALLVFGVVLLPWGLYAQATFGSILPDTLAAKLGQTESGRWGTGLLYLSNLVEHLTAHWTRLLMVLATGGGLAYLLVDRRWLAKRGAVLLLAWNGLYLLAYTLLNPPGYVWYFTPLAVGSAVILALAAEAVYTRFLAQYIRGDVFALAVIVGGALLLAFGIAIQVDRPFTYKYINYRNAAEWLNEHAHAGASVGAHEIGVVGYLYTHGPIIDAAGLVTPNVAEYVADRDYFRYIHEYEPDFIMTDQPPRPILEAMVVETWFHARYRLAVVIDSKYRAVAIYQRRDTG